MTDQQKMQIEKLRLAGCGYKKISGILCISVNTVKSYCRKNNLTGVKGGKPPSFTHCKKCGKQLIQKSKQKRMIFCSKECRQGWWKANPDMLNKKAVYSFLCPGCNKSFTAYGNSKRKYCSHQCYILSRFGKTGDTK